MQALFVALLLLTPTFAGGAGAQTGDPAAGKDLVETWCTSCHVVGDAVPGPDAGPPLPVLLADQLRTPDQIRGWLMDPHGFMPDFQLTRQEIEDVVSYLESVRREAQDSTR